MTTPKTWPEATMPTPEQLADWLAACDREERITLAKRIIYDAGAASACFMQNHEALVHEVERMRGDYQRGFDDACRKIRDGLAAS